MMTAQSKRLRVETRFDHALREHPVDLSVYQAALDEIAIACTDLLDAFEREPDDIKLMQWAHRYARQSDLLRLTAPEISAQQQAVLVKLWSNLGQEHATFLATLKLTLAAREAGLEPLHRFDMLITRATQVERHPYLDFIYEYAGRVAAQEGDSPTAVAHLNLALELRSKKKNPKHAMQTQALIDLVTG